MRTQTVWTFLITFAAVLASLSLPARAEDTETAPTSTHRRNTGIPLYHFHRPSWGFELATAYRVLDDNPNIKAAGGNAYSVSIQAEYQPPFFQSLGVLGLGPSLAVYPITGGGGGATNSQLGIWSAGGQIRYQARFFREQILVPVAGYAAELITYHLSAGGDGRLTAKGPVLGAYLLLNSFDSEAAADFYVNSGITRSYLIAEYRNLTGSSDQLNATKGTVYVGLRLEL